MSPCHPDRVRRNTALANFEQDISFPVNLSESTVINTDAIKSVERDVRAVLVFMDQQYTNDDLRQAMKRLRHWVGY